MVGVNRRVDDGVLRTLRVSETLSDKVLPMDVESVALMEGADGVEERSSYAVLVFEIRRVSERVTNGVADADSSRYSVRLLDDFGLFVLDSW